MLGNNECRLQFAVLVAAPNGGSCAHLSAASSFSTASFSTALHVAGHVFPLLHCAYGVRQATYQRRRLSTKVRYESVYLLTLGEPAFDDCLGYVPLLALGGPETE